MKQKYKKLPVLLLAGAISATVLPSSVLPNGEMAYCHAADTLGNIILSCSTLTTTAASTASFCAALPEGMDASKLMCVVADNTVAATKMIASSGNVAAFEISYINPGQTVAAVYLPELPSMISYIPVCSAPIIVQAPSRLGASKSNYCKLVSYEFAPYRQSAYQNLNDYSSVIRLKYKCCEYNDKDYKKWGCYASFIDADGNVISKVHLYAGYLSKGRVYTSEFNVPVNAVKFVIEGA